MNSDDERRIGSRHRDWEIDRWRGQITERVDSHERKFAEHNGDLRHLRDQVDCLRDDVTILKGQIAEARTDIGDATLAMRQGREQEVSSLRAAIHESKITPKDLWMNLALPIGALVIGTLIVFLLVGHHLG